MDDNYCRSESMKTVDAILSAILQWRVAWIKEQKLLATPPPICRQISKKLKINYESYKDYESTFVPMLMHEIWSQIYEECSRDSNVDVNLSKQFWMGISEYHTCHGHKSQLFLELRCHYLVEADNLQRHLKLINDGDLVKIDLSVDDLLPDHAGEFMVSSDGTKNTKVLSLFGYVTDVITERVNQHTKLAECYVDRSNTKGILLITYVVNVARRPLRLKLKEPMRISGLYYLRPMLRQIESVVCLRESKLCSDILSPRTFTCQLPLPTVVELTSLNYNAAQYKAIVGVHEAILMSHPKLQLIQGPPGTGKTHTLIGIIKHLYHEWRDYDNLPKILVCAPSNGAIDEVCKRLYAERAFLRKSPARRSLRMVRVGKLEQIHADVRKIHLDVLVDTNTEVKKEDIKKRHDEKIKDLEEQLSRFDIEISNLRALNRHNQVPQVEAKVAEALLEISNIKTSATVVAKRELSEASKRNTRFDLIKNADVILTTLNSSQKHPLDLLFKSEKASLSFKCVIVDEASQCCEPELLMPLNYGIDKMVLIGDPMQLPATVISRHAQDHGFSRSLFERFFIHFGQYTNDKSPIIMLTDQYRMHPDICRFPSKQFYDNRLVTKTSADRRRYPTKPYVMFDLRHGVENRSDKTNVMNEVEANFVRQLLLSVLNELPRNSSVGVITPYQGQRRLITHKISSLQSEKNITIDVNTCDGFQGQERDVIILSCVRAFEQGSNGHIGFMKSTQRMNVALTRAKHSLFVCISAKSLAKDANWGAMIEDARSRGNLQTLTQNPALLKLRKMIGIVENAPMEVPIEAPMEEPVEEPMDVDMLGDC